MDCCALWNFEPLVMAAMAEILRCTRPFHLANRINARHGPVDVRTSVEAQYNIEISAFLEQTLSPSEFHPSITADVGLTREAHG